MDQAFDDWIGRTREASDRVTARLVAEYASVLNDMSGPGQVPAGFHWCLAPDICAPEDLGRDGHPKTGIFLPKLPLPRRMWAGGAVRHLGGFAVGDEVTRRSTIADITFKDGRSGRLGFVTVEHRYDVAGETRLSERQDIVYRADPAPGATTPPPAAAEGWDAIASAAVVPDATQLFRYSAVTFNGHRIHYDQPYATGVEGYDGLVVHGPLQSSWMQNLAAGIIGHVPRHFEYRGLSPLVADVPVTVEARQDAQGLELRVRRDADGVVTMKGRASD